MTVKIMIYNIFRLLLIVLVFFDFLFFNVKLSFVSVTLLRVVIAILAVGLVLYSIKYGIKKPGTLFEKSALLFFLFWFFWSVIQFPFTAQKIETFKGVYYLATFLAIIFLVNFKLNSNVLNKMLGLMSYIYIILVCIGYVEIFTNRHFSISKIVIEELVMKAATGVFYNQNDYSLFLVTFLPLALYFFKNKLIQAVILTSTIGLIVINESFLALAAVMLQLLFIVFNIKMDFRLKFIYILNLFVLCLVILPKIVNLYSQFLVQIQVQSGSAYIRLTLIQNTLDIIGNQSLLMGIGLNNLSAALMRYSSTVIANPHNWWLELIATSGIFVFIGYILLFGYIFIYSYVHREQRILFYSFISIIGFIIACVGPSSLFNMTFVWLYYALLISVIRMNHVEKRCLDSKSEV